ncbi:MAG: hypothetical protein KGH98_01545 [Candidatus Micrarchaeota archaeon]|nr:hypothetical protein [Candidatus Micrarchaeota archaeon]
MRPTCSFETGFEKRLGFARILSAGKDFAESDIDQKRGAVATLAIGSDESGLIEAVKRGAKAVVISDLTIGKKLIETMKANGTVLCLPMSMITETYGDRRVRNTYKMSKLFAYAKKQGLEVSVVSMAASKESMCSYMQLIQLARLIGAEERYARYSLSEVNRIFGRGS